MNSVFKEQSMWWFFGYGNGVWCRGREAARHLVSVLHIVSWAASLQWALNKTPNSLPSIRLWSLLGLSLKYSLRNNPSRQSFHQLACWLPTLSEIGLKGFHMFTNQPLLICVNFPSLLLLPSHLMVKNTRQFILKNTDTFWSVATKQRGESSLRNRCSQFPLP